MTANQLAPGGPSNWVGGGLSSPRRRSFFGSAEQQAAFLGKPMSSARCVLGWAVATGIFLACASIWYSPNVPDNLESIVPAVAIEKGSLHCAYPPSALSSVPPLFPLVAAGVMEITRVGTSEADAFLYTGPHCDVPRAAAHHEPVSAEQPLFLLGFIGWPVLLAGFIALLRAAGRGRSRWEFLGACLLGCTPAVTAPIIEFFHPEDLVAMGLILMALAAAIRSRWLVAGVCIGLACCSKQYSLLALAPLLVVAPRRERWRFLLAAVCVAAVILVPFAIMIGKGALEAIAATHATPGGTNTVVGRLHLHGVELLAASRVLPLALAAMVAAWARSRLESKLYRPQPFVALVAVSLALRLVFEVNLFGYYFMATAVALIAIDIAVGRLRVETIGWIVVTAAFYPPIFEPLVLVAGRDSLIVQPVLALSGLALAALPLYRMCVSQEPVAESTDARPLRSITVSSS